MQSRLAFIWLLVVSYTVNAQSDKIYFKNRSVILGTVHALNKDSALVSFNQQELRFSTADLYSVLLKGSKNESINQEVLDSLNKSGFTNKFDKTVLFGVMTGGGENNAEINPSLTLTGVYRFKRLLQLGLALGYERYGDYNNLPVYLYYKGDLFRHFSGVYYYAGVGYGKLWEKDYMDRDIEKIRGGSVIKMGFGFIFASKSNVDWVAAVGWSRQEMEEEYPLYYTWLGEAKTEVSKTMNRLEFKIGICF